MNKKIYCFVDETGQDTNGKLFIVSIVLSEGEIDKLEKRIERIEKLSSKGNIKWSRSRDRIRIAFIEEICKEFKGEKKLRFSVFKGTRDYDLATLNAISKAIHYDTQDIYKANVYIDALSKTKRRFYGSELRKLGISVNKVQGIVKDENHPIVRLADAVAGWSRDAIENDDKKLVKLFEMAIRQKTVIEI